MLRGEEVRGVGCVMCVALAWLLTLEGTFCNAFAGNDILICKVT